MLMLRMFTHSIRCNKQEGARSLNSSGSDSSFGHNEGSGKYSKEGQIVVLDCNCIAYTASLGKLQIFPGGHLLS